MTVVLFFLFIFASKLVIKFDMMKEINRKEEFVVPGDYYRKLERKEKGKFLDYLSFNYGMNVNTTRNKLLGNNGQELNTLERIVVTDVINQGLWKESNFTAAQTGTCISGATGRNRND